MLYTLDALADRTSAAEKSPRAAEGRLGGGGRTGGHVSAFERNGAVGGLHVQRHGVHVQRLAPLALLAEDRHERHVRLRKVGVQLDALQQVRLRRRKVAADEARVGDFHEIHALRRHRAAADLRRPPLPRAPPAATRRVEPLLSKCQRAQHKAREAHPWPCRRRWPLRRRARPPPSLSPSSLGCHSISLALPASPAGGARCVRCLRRSCRATSKGWRPCAARVALLCTHGTMNYLS